MAPSRMPTWTHLTGLVNLLQPGQNHLFAGLLQLSSQKDLVQNRVDLVKVEHQIQLANVAEKRIQNLHKQMNCLQIEQFIVTFIDHNAEKQASIASVNYLVIVQFHEITLVSLISGCNQTVHFSHELDFFRVLG